MLRRWITMLLVAMAVMSLAAQTAAQARLEVTAPTNGATIDGTSVTVEFTASGLTIVPTDVPLDQAGMRPEANRPGEGHVHLMLDTLPIVVWEQYSPYTFTNVPPGEHQLTVELVENDHGPLSPPVVQQIRFRTVSNQLMPLTGEPQGRNSGPLALALLVGITLLGSGVVLRRVTR